MRILPALIAIVLAGCGTAATTSGEPTTTTARTVVVHRSPACGCCHEWAAFLSAAGWQVTTVDEADMTAFKTRLAVPDEAWSCHTAIIDGYVVEGHVPLAAIEDLLARRPAITGIALPGMPAGSPGMGGGQQEPFEVLSFGADGVDAFGSY